MKEVQDRVVQFSNRYKLTNADTGEVLGTFDFDEVTGTVTEAGTEINKKLFDSIAEDFTAIINGTQPVGAVGATQLTNEDLNTLYGADWWGKTLFMAGGNSVLNKPAGVNAGNVNILRGAVNSTVQIVIGTGDSTGNSPAPNIYIRRLLNSTASWDDWEQIVTADGSYPTLGAGYLARNLEVANGRLTNQYYKLCTYTSPKVANSSSFIFLINGIYGDQSTAFAAESGLLEFDIRSDSNGVFLPNTGLSILSGNLKPEDFFIVVSDDLSSVSLYSHLYQQFGTQRITQIDGDRDNPVVFDGTRYATPPDGAVYAVLRNNASSADIAADSEKLNGKAASDIFESDGVTAKEATNAQKLGNKAAEEYALANDIPDIPDVSNFAEKDGTYSDMTVGNAEKLGNKAASEYALASDIPDVSNFAEKTGTYSEMSVGNATNATNIIPDENGAVNPLGRKENGVVGDYSTALGNNAEASGIYSTALGDNAEASGLNSTALGNNAEASGIYSTALGDYAKAFGSNSTALGYGAKASGLNSTALGDYAKAFGSNSTALGYGATVLSTDENIMQLGNINISSLRCAVNLTVTSDKRDKTDIASIADALAFIERLNPVTFVSNDRVNYISEEDKQSENYQKYGMCDYDRIAHAAGTKKGERRRCGLLAQEVIEAMQSVYRTDNYANIVNDNFHDLQEKPSEVENKYTLAYANLVPFLIGAIKELNAKIKELEGKYND